MSRFITVTASSRGSDPGSGARGADELAPRMGDDLDIALSYPEKVWSGSGDWVWTTTCTAYSNWKTAYDGRVRYLEIGTPATHEWNHALTGRDAVRKSIFMVGESGANERPGVDEAAVVRGRITSLPRRSDKRRAIVLSCITIMAVVVAGVSFYVSRLGVYPR
jgi:hypothetical protein